MSGGTPQQPTQTTSTQISPEASQLFSLAYPGLQNFAANTPERYQGPTVAGFTPAQTSGQEQLLGAAGSQKQIADQALAGLSQVQNLPWDVANSRNFQGQDLTTSSNIFNDQGIWNPNFNAGTAAAIDAAQRPLYQNLQEQVLPNIRSGAITAGGLGGSRQGIAEGLAAGRTAQAAGDVGSKIVEDLYGANLGAVNSRYATNIGAENQRYATNTSADQAMYATNIGAQQGQYNTNVQALISALGLTPMLQQAVLQPGLTTSAVGDVQQAMNQAQIGSQVANWNYDQFAPFLASKEIASLIQGLPGATTTSTGNVPTPDPWTQALGGGLSGAAIGSSFGPLGAGVGAAGGAVLPFALNALRR